MAKPTKELTKEVRRLIDMPMTYRALAEFIGLKNHAVLYKVYDGRDGVSRKMENEIRKGMGLDLLPSIEMVEVPPGAKVKIVKPQPKRERRRRLSVPAHSIEAMADYLTGRDRNGESRLTYEEIHELAYYLDGWL